MQAAAVAYMRLTSILLKNPLFWRQHLGFVALSAKDATRRRFDMVMAWSVDRLGAACKT
jgi:hypothetical protein